MALADGASVLRLTHAQYETVVSHCFDGFPDEACGLFAGPLDGSSAAGTGEVTAAYPCQNADQSARTYTVDSRDYLRAMRDAESRGTEIIGVWHSHTHTDAYPSPTDVRQAVDPAWWYVIVSLKHGEPVLRAFQIRDESITEVPVAVG
jgi:[CysO sulfur-carrier protein]-S-L-cysteine hydrolase